MENYNNFDIIIYTDGSCKNNGSENSVGGWSFVILFDDFKKEIQSSGFVESTTNQRMELQPIIEALQEIKLRWSEISSKKIIIFSDAQYVIKGANEWMFNWQKKGWRRTSGYTNGKPSKKSIVKHLDLWQTLYDLVAIYHPTFKWVKGHDNLKYNVLCDTLARQASHNKITTHRVIRHAEAVHP